MLEAIAGAKTRISFESFIIRADRTGELFAQALIARAQAGVEVRFSYDALGSYGLPDAFCEKLRRAGVKVLEFHPLHSFGAWRTLNRRNHRKILVIDGSIGFVGGINIADDYAPVSQGGGGWRDTHLRFEGPAAGWLEALFLRTWVRETIERFVEPLPRRAFDGGVLMRVLGGRNLRERRLIRGAYLRAIRLAEKEVLITNAYFLPDPVLIRALAGAVKRGVTVKVILGGTTSDVPWVGFAALSVYGKLLRRGVEIFEWKDRVLHAKTAVVDGIWSTVGSYNLDYRSLLHNLEVNAAILDPGFGAQMQAMFARDLLASRRVTMDDWESRSWTERMRDWIAYRFRFLL